LVFILTAIVFGIIENRKIEAMAIETNEMINIESNKDTINNNEQVIATPCSLGGGVTNIDDLATSSDGKRIDNSEIIKKMTVFADNTTGCCGFVAMGILLQFYNKLPSEYTGQYIPSEMYYGSSDYQQQERAERLKEYLMSITDTGILEWFGDASLPHQQAEGLINYFNNQCPEIDNYIAGYFLTEEVTDQYMVDLINRNRPFLVTAASYTIEGYEESKKDHVMVVYGYKKVDEKIKYLVHLGWRNNPTDAWIDIETIYGFCYIDNVPLQKYDFETTEDGTGTVITGVRGDCPSVLEIPAIYNGLPVVAIGDYAFKNRLEITSINLPETLTAIGYESFSGCVNLSNLINLPNSITNIGVGAFWCCTKLSQAILPSGLTEISSHLFYGCSQLTNVTLPETITKIGEFAFSETGLTYIALPSGLVEILYSAFYHCIQLKEIILPDTITHIGVQAFCKCKNLCRVVLPSGITELSEETFFDCEKLNTINFPNSITRIGKKAFLNTGLTQIVLPESVLVLEEYAFAYCVNLSSIEVNAYIEIGECAFLGCTNITNEDIPLTASVIKKNAFKGCNITKAVYIPKTIERIEENALGTTTATFYLLERGATSTTLENNWNNGCAYFSNCKLDPIGNYISSVGSSFIPEGKEVYLPEREGYLIGAWHTTSSFLDGEKYYDILTAPKQKYYVKWVEDKTVSVTYKDVGDMAFSGELAENRPTTHKTGTTTLLINPTKFRYNFKGWCLTVDGSGEIITSLYPDCDSDVVLYAKWEAETYDIVYLDQNGEELSGTQPTSQDLVHTFGEEKTLYQPTKTGYIFNGWYLDSTCTGESLTTLSATGYLSDITLYAKWQAKTNNIVYLDQDGEPFSGTLATGTPVTFTSGQSVDLLEPTKSTEGFAGWYDTPECNGQRIFSICGEYDNEIVVYAKWIEEYVLQFRDIGDWSYSGQPYYSEESLSYLEVFSLPENPTKKGYTFLGWYKESNASGEPIQSITAEGDKERIKVYAKWQAKTNNIVYLDQGGEPFSGTLATGTPVTFTSGQSVDLLEPTKSTAGFAGWYDNSECEGSLKSQLYGGYDGEIVLYAKWIEEYTLIFRDIGDISYTGNHNYDNEILNYGTNYVLPENPIKTGFTFLGWYMTFDSYGDNVQSISASGYQEEIKVYAKWRNDNPTECWDGIRATEFSGVTEKGNIAISNAAELALMVYEITRGDGYADNYELTDDIYINDTTEWEIWQEYDTMSKANASGYILWNTKVGFKGTPNEFTGLLEGNGHVIYGLFVAYNGNSGLIQILGEGGEIRNLGIEKSYVYSNTCAGGIVGRMNGGSINNCYNAGDVRSKTLINCYAGGIVGMAVAGSQIWNSCSFGNVFGETEGIAGQSSEEAPIENSFYVVETENWKQGTEQITANGDYVYLDGNALVALNEWADSYGYPYWHWGYGENGITFTRSPILYDEPISDE